MAAKLKKRCIVKVLSMLFVLLTILFTSLSAYGHGDEEGSSKDSNGSTELDFASLSLNLIYGASIISILALSWYLTLKNPHQFHKRIVFDVIAVVVVIATLFMIFSTLYVNITSPTHGPVHWHADFEINLCNTNYELYDPIGLSNRVGTNLLHEHNDNRIHVEGVPRTLDEISLGKFFEKVESYITETEFHLHSSIGEVTVKNNDVCNGKLAALYVFAEKQSGRERKWSRLDNAGDYVLSPYSTIPPGDRLKIIFNEKNEKELLAELNGADENNIDIVIR